MNPLIQQFKARTHGAASVTPAAGRVSAGRQLEDSEVGHALVTESKAATLSGPSMNLRDFYSAVLPPAGPYLLFHSKSKQHTSAATIDELVAKTHAESDATDTYYAVSSFIKPGSRKGENVALLKAHRIDIDAGAEKLKKHGSDEVYATQQEAKEGLAIAISSGLPKPSIVVSSGEGLHVYWVLDEAVEPQTWKRTALKINTVAKGFGLKVDAAVTADIARVLRPIGTLHPKGNRVAVLGTSNKTWTNAELDAALAAHLPEEDAFATAPAPKSAKAPNLNDDILKAFEGPPASLAIVADHCAAVAKMRDLGGNIPEPHWRAVMGVAKYCTIDGERLIHAWSSGHADYDRHETQAKFDRWETPPTTCAFFDTVTKACTGCRYKGKVTTPKQLGRIPNANAAGGGSPVHDASILPARALPLVLPDMKRNRDGIPVSPLPTVPNLREIARAAGIVVRFNVMQREVEISVPNLTSERSDYQTAAEAALTDEAVRAGLAADSVGRLVGPLAGEDPYHPAKDWIESKDWDQQDRIEAFHSTICLHDGGKRELANKLLDAWMLQGIGALYEGRGIAAPGVLVLASGQEVGKSRWINGLCDAVPGAVRPGAFLDPTERDSISQNTSAWITELAELDGMTARIDVARLKAFLDRVVDVVRLPYGRRNIHLERRTIFAASVNGTGFLRDDTGNRRFWVIDVAECTFLSSDEMQQVWAQYAHRYRRGERWHLDAETKRARNEQNEQHAQIDPLKERILIRWDWGRTTRPGWESAPGVAWKTATATAEELGLQKATRAEATRVGAILRELSGKSRVRSGATFWALPPRSVGHD